MSRNYRFVSRCVQLQRLTMYDVTRLFVLIILNGVLICSKKCVEVSFPKIPVLVGEVDKMEYQYVTGCVSPSTFSYKKGQLKNITITRQTLPSLNKGAFSDIDEAVDIFLRRNKISTIKEEVFFNMSNIKDISMNGNQINWIETNAFFNLPTLSLLDLENNEIEMLLQNSFNDLPNVTYLNLAKNRLEFFKQDWFFKMPKVQVLFLNGNRIVSLPRAAFITLTSLEYMDFSDNKIQHIHKKAFEKLTKLKEVQFSNNLLRAFEIDFQWSPNLQSVIVNKNNLTYVSEKMLKQVQHSLKNLWVNSNPLQCACLDYLLNWGRENDVRVTFACKSSNVVCVIPKINPSQCSERPESDFHSDYNANFLQDCQHIY